jgi:hypothetical protein
MLHQCTACTGQLVCGKVAEVLVVFAGGLVNTADLQFALRSVMDNMDKDYLVLGALAYRNMDMVCHILEAEPHAKSF